mgnify:FL=1
MGSVSDLTFDPEMVSRSGEGGGDASAGSGLDADTSEDPLAEGADEDPLAPKGGGADADARVAKTSDDGFWPRAAGWVGLGVWLRSLDLNQPDTTKRQPPKYRSGAAFSIGLGFKVRPAAFFLDNFAANFYSRLEFQTMVGLESRNLKKNPDDTTTVQLFGTSLWQLRWEVVGYDWKILDSPSSPHLEGGIGFGLMRFAIDWGSDMTDQPMPDASYRYFLISLGGRIPFHERFGAHARFDYRAVTRTGQIEEDRWYGPSSTGGVGIVVGVNGNWKGIVARVEYGYTRYFYAFKEGDARVSACQTNGKNDPACKPAAGGALDQLHSVLLSVGYSY